VRYKSTYPKFIAWVVSIVVDNVVSVVIVGWKQHDDLNASVKKVHDSVPLSISTAALIASMQ
jgi:hypothetical protein